MKLQLLLGPPASGRTAAMVDLARTACQAGRRVWWIGLPTQRVGVFRRVTSDGFTALGLEVMSSQQMYYRLLTGPDFVDLKPLVVGTARLVRVAAALAESVGGLPSPGEAKLFAAAVAEAKRFGLGPDDVRREAEAAGNDVEIHRLATVFEAYQAAMDGSWDYDDVRAQAVRLVAGEAFARLMADQRQRARATLPDLVIVDGLRELGPLDFEALIELGELVEAHLTLPELTESVSNGAAARVRLSPSTAADGGTTAIVHRHLAPNDVAEARFVMRSLKRDLAEGGFDPLELAVVATPGTATAVLALASEYGLPLMDETPTALADTPEGATLLDLLELAETPTASRLLAIPQLAPLAAEALRLGVGGADALTRLARDLGVEESWRGWLRRLRVGDEPVEWTRWLLGEVLVLMHPRPEPAFIARVMTLAQEAASLASGEGFAVWLAALLRDARSRKSAPGGIALLDSKLVSGRRYRKVYVMGAVEGAYRAGEREDYFISEDLRAAERPTMATSDGRSVRLPRRLQGRDEDVAAELLSRAQETVITAPEAGSQGTLRPDGRLFAGVDLSAGSSAAALPPVPAGSALELGGSKPYRPHFGEVEPRWAPAEPGAEFLRRYDRCALRTWGETVLLPDDPEPEPDWHSLLSRLTANPQLTPERLEELRHEFPDFTAWLGQHAELLSRLYWGPRFKHRESGATAYVHAGLRETIGSRGRQRFALYRFVAPADDTADWQWGRDQQRHRWTEYLAADTALRHSGRAPDQVEVVVWPLLGEPLTVDRSTNDFVAKRLQSVGQQATEASRRLQAGDVSPQPGFHCRDCPIFETCRVGRRT